LDHFEQTQNTHFFFFAELPRANENMTWLNLFFLAMFARQTASAATTPVLLRQWIDFYPAKEILKSTLASSTTSALLSLEKQQTMEDINLFKEEWLANQSLINAGNSDNSTTNFQFLSQETLLIICCSGEIAGTGSAGTGSDLFVQMSPISWKVVHQINPSYRAFYDTATADTAAFVYFSSALYIQTIRVHFTSSLNYHLPVIYVPLKTIHPLPPAANKGRRSRDAVQETANAMIGENNFFTYDDVCVLALLFLMAFVFAL
jgi:hypothetical protein